VLSGTTTDYIYDASGDRTEAAIGGTPTVTASYNGAAELTGYANSAANMTAATYDGDGLRTAATATPTGGGSTTQDFVWNTAPSVPELLMDSDNVYVYGPNGTPFEQVDLSTGTITYLVSDALGSVRGVVSSAGSLTASTAYDAWGNPETTGGLTAETPFGYAGGYTDPSGLIYLVNRYFDPATGQFLTVDPDVAETGEPYAYAGDNPSNAVDPLGLCSTQGSYLVPGACDWTSKSWVAQTENTLQGQKGGGFSILNGLRAVADYGAAIGNVVTSTVTLGHVQVTAPYCGFGFASDTGTIFGTLALGVLGGGAGAAGEVAEGTATVEEVEAGAQAADATVDQGASAEKTGSPDRSVGR
jgi:RHS repeat-associated protein